MEDIGKNLKRIRLLKSLSLKEAGKLVNMSAPALLKYEKGQVIPNSNKLIEFANAYNVSITELLKSNSNYNMSFKSFRKKKKLEGQNLDLLKEIINNKVNNYIEVLDLNNIYNYEFKLKSYMCNNLDDASIAAYNFKRDYNISKNQPISDLISLLENIGINIIQIENINNKFNGFDGLSEIVNNIPFIILMDYDDGARERFTIAHELGHLLLKINNESIDQEKACNIFASSLLMPKEAVIKEFGESRNNISLYELLAFKLEYKVSIAAILYRLRELNIISEYLYKKITIKLNSLGYKKDEPNNINKEKSNQYTKLVHKLYADEIITINKACELLGVSENDYYIQDNNYRY